MSKDRKINGKYQEIILSLYNFFKSKYCNIVCQNQKCDVSFSFILLFIISLPVKTTNMKCHFDQCVCCKNVEKTVIWKLKNSVTKSNFFYSVISKKKEIFEKELDNK